MQARFSRPQLFTLALLALAAGVAISWLRSGASGQEATASLLDRYCMDCHNAAEFAGNLVIVPGDAANATADPEHWEKVVRKLRTRTMPPEGPRPAPEEYSMAAAYLEDTLDAQAAAEPNPGDLPLFRRLTRTEYSNAIRDLLGIDNMPSELDFELLLPADNASSGFDNIAELLFVSPVVMERYVAAAQKIARLAVGDMRAPAMVNIHQLSEQLPQDERVDALPFGTRGGLAIETYLPLDADYVIDVETARQATEPHEIEISVDGERAAVQPIGYGPRIRGLSESGDRLRFKVPIEAGPHNIGVTFVQRSEALDENTVRVRLRGRGPLPAIAMATVSGPFDATGPGDTPSRQRILVCAPRSTAEELPCAREILSTLARRAYRRPISDADLEDLLPFYESGRTEGSFDTGIQFALERLLVSPQFLYRIEQEPAGPAMAAPISDLELASRLSFFLWSSIPDDVLLEKAASGELRTPGVLGKEVRRMLADPRSESMVTNFAAQWLFLRDVGSKEPDIFVFPDYDASLRAALERETELFVDSVLRGGRNVTELLTAKYTFLNERLAKHYGIPNIQGSYFRRVELGDASARGGLLGQGSILAVTSYSTRTSPVLRGKYVLDNLLATPPPPPPPDVPALVTESEDSGAPLSMRDAMARHRANPACASCHARMDPIGLALEQFDATGRWREADAGAAIDTKGVLADGRIVNGVDGVKSLVVAEPDIFVSALTEKLMMYALGRNVQYYDAPAIRAIVRSAAEHNYEFSAIVEGIVESVPFQMRRAREAPRDEISTAAAGLERGSER